jgi:hypothetical protein
MKIAINRCFGGFGISHKAVMRYAELSGITLYPFTEKRDSKGTLDWDHFEPYNNQKNILSIFYSTKPLGNDGSYADDSWWSERDIERNDPVLINVIEEMGQGANGNHAKIEIIEIPDDVNWQIDEYDGQESIHEVHRSW